MDWNDYKELVSSSRSVIVKPLLLEVLNGITGIGIDIGCGDGEIAAEIINKFGVSVIGADINFASTGKGKCLYGSKMQFVCGDLTKRIISKIGIDFDFAYSNCAYNSLSNHDVVSSIDDIRSCLKPNSLFVILVPHWKRAESNYKKIKCISEGISAVPEYGERQYFRYGEWYCKVLENAGFTIEEHRTILIPKNESLSERYQKDFGKEIFSLIIAKAKTSNHRLKMAKKAFDVAHSNRAFEIDMLWKRSLFYWGFIASAFVGFVTTHESTEYVSLMFAAFGFICSLAWAAGNRGSKYWQEYWEDKVVLFQNQVTGDIFLDHFPKRNKLLSQFAPRRISVSKLIIGISDYAVIVWLCILAFRLFYLFYELETKYIRLLKIAYILFTIFYGIYLLWQSYHKRDDC